jgi:hypothetical protein
MERFAAFADAALKARIGRLRRAEVDLLERIEARKSGAEAEGRWIPSDPMYQRLTSVLRQVRSDLSETERAHSKRTASRDRGRHAAA